MIVSITLGLLFIIGYIAFTLDTLNNVKPAYRLKTFFTCCIIFTFGNYIGYQSGYVISQGDLLRSKKSFYRVEIQEVAAYDNRGVRYVRTDTLYNLSLTEQLLYVPIANPVYYINRRDTLWTKAVYTYSLK